MLFGLLFNFIVVFVAVFIEDRFQFIHCVIRKLYVFIKTGLEAGIAAYKLFHRFGISGHDDDQVVAIVLHRFQDRVDSLLAECIILLGESVGLIDEENPADCFCDLFLGLNGSLTHISGDKAGAVHFDQLSFGQYADLLVQPGQYSGHRSFPGTRIARKYQVLGHRRFLQAALLPELLDQREIRHIPDILLDRFETDQLVQRLHRVFFRFIMPGFFCSIRIRRGGIADFQLIFPAGIRRQTCTCGMLTRKHDDSVGICFRSVNRRHSDFFGICFRSVNRRLSGFIGICFRTGNRHFSRACLLRSKGSGGVAASFSGS